jgi:hypothetical protein
MFLSRYPNILAVIPADRRQVVVDIDLELNKCQKKLELAQLSLNKIIAAEAKSDVIPENVKLANEEKVGLACEMGNLLLKFLSRNGT